MDPVLIDPVAALGSITGIVGLTIAVTHVIKRRAGDATILKNIPVWVYALTVSALLTYLSHSVFHTISGELPLLLFQAVISTILAAGTIEMARTWNKPISETSTAIETRIEKAREDDHYDDAA